VPGSALGTKRARNTSSVKTGALSAAGRRFRFAIRGAPASTLAIILLMLANVHAGGALAADARQQDWNAFDRLVAQAHASMMAHPDAAMLAAKAATAIATRHRSERRYREAVATSLWLEAEALNRTNHTAEARRAITRASELAPGNGKFTRLQGEIALSRGGIAESSGDLGLALKSYQKAHATFVRLRLRRFEAIALLELGGLYDRAHDFDREIRYYREAAKIYSGDLAISLAATNNLGFAYERMGHYGEAIPRFQQALTIARSLKSPILEASILDNLAVCYARLRRLADAERAADRALTLTRKRDAGGEARFSWGAKAEIAYRRGDFGSAAADLQKAFRGVNLKATPTMFRDMHEIAYKVYRTTGDLPLAMIHFEAFKRLDDEGRSLAASANLALLGAKFDFARQDLEIAQLRSAELERSIRLRKSQAEVQAIVFAGIIVAGILLLLWVAWRHVLLTRHRNTIAQKNTELVKTLAERDREIERRTEVESHLRLAMQAAQQASRAKSHFLANTSHELRTPLNAIIGFSELILGGRMHPAKTLEYAGDIAQGGRHLLAVLNNVLDMARIESGKMELEDRLIRLGDVVNQALSVFGGRNGHAGKELRITGDENLLVRVDEVRLRQVIINLVSNAVKFTREGNLIEIRLERTAEGVDVVVQDNGEGIPADKLPIIMEPFGQAESTYARSHGGVGLGLPIVKALVELHGGRFTIESEYGQGTVARVHLPQERVADRGGQSSITKAVQAA